MRPLQPRPRGSPAPLASGFLPPVLRPAAQRMRHEGPRSTSLRLRAAQAVGRRCCSGEWPVEGAWRPLSVAARYDLRLPASWRELGFPLTPESRLICRLRSPGALMEETEAVKGRFSGTEPH